MCGAAESFAEPHSNRPLWPLLVDVRPEKLPTPLQAMGRQVRRGETPEEFRRLLEDLLDYLGELNRLVASDQRSAVALIDHSVQRFDREVLEWRRQADTGPTESAILEWCSRLDGLFNSGQYRDVNQFHRWFNITLHRSEDKAGEALDQRIHRRLGELYLASGQAVPAAKEFGLAVSLAPRDIYLLRCLGQAQLDSKNVQATKECLDEIERLDPQAFSENVDCAALKGRYLRSIALYEQARDAYLEASRMNPRSFYLRDLLGQAHLAIPDFDEAETEYREALRIISTSGDRTLWAHATAAAAHLVLNQLDELEHELEQIGDLNPSPGKREKIVASLQDINNRLLPDKQVLNAVLDRRRRVLPAH